MPFACRPNPECNKPPSWCLTLAAFALLFADGAWDCTGQALDGAPWPGDPPATIEVFVGWDFSDMTPEEMAAFTGIMNPVSSKEIERKLTPEQIAARQIATFSMLQPEEFARQYPTSRTPEEVASAEFQRWAMSNPAEARILFRQARTREQLEQDDMAQWFITHPNEAWDLRDHMTAEQLDAQMRALWEVEHPVLKPVPVFETVPFGGSTSPAGEAEHN